MKVGIVLHPNFKQAFLKLHSVKLPIKELIEWKKFSQTLFEEIAVLEDVKKDLVVECSEKDENGKMVFITGNEFTGGTPKFAEGMIEVFSDKIKELFDQDLKTEIRKIKVSSSFEISAADYELLQDFILLNS